MTALTATFDLVERKGLPVASDLHSYIREIMSYPVLTKEEETDLANEHIKNGNSKAARVLVYCHLRQVVAIARLYRGYGIAVQDLIQEGNIGLMKAVKKFEPTHNARLSTYATYWIKAAINEYVIKNWKIVKVATTSAQRKLFFNLRSATSNLGRRLGLKDVQKIAKDFDVTNADVLEMEKRMVLHDVPFESDVDADSEEIDTSPSATLTSEDGMHAETMIVEKSEKNFELNALHEALGLLTSRERDIVEARSLSESGKDVKLGDLATRFGISSERIRQIEANALKKIKKHVLATCSPAIS